MIIFNNFYNQNFDDKNFINILNVNILEVLTDEYSSQKMSLENFTGECYKKFRYYLDYLFHDLTKLN